MSEQRKPYENSCACGSKVYIMTDPQPMPTVLTQEQVHALADPYRQWVSCQMKREEAGS